MKSGRIIWLKLANKWKETETALLEGIFSWSRVLNFWSYAHNNEAAAQERTSSEFHNLPPQNSPQGENDNVHEQLK